MAAPDETSGPRGPRLASAHVPERNHLPEAPSAPFFDVVGIGNALVDVIAHNDDGFLDTHSLVKGAMTLIDTERAVSLYRVLGTALEMSGGSAATCTTEGADVADPGFLRLAVDDTGRLTWGQCKSSGDLGTCTDEFYSFDSQGGAWKIGAATSASESGGLCTLYHAEGSVTVIGDSPKKIRLEIKEWDAYPMAGEKPCTLDSAGALGGDTDCAEHVVIEATAL